MLNKRYIKEVTIADRKFRIEIYDDNYWGLPYTEIYEVYRKKKNLFDSSYEERLFKYWYDEDLKNGCDRITIAMQKIQQKLSDEKEYEEFKKILDKWADYTV